MSEVTIDTFLKDRLDFFHLLLSNGFLSTDKKSEILLSVSTYTQLSQMLFIIRVSDEMNLKKDVGSIKIMFGQTMQKLICEDINSLNKDFKAQAVENIMRLQIIGEQIAVLTEIKPCPLHES